MSIIKAGIYAKLAVWVLSIMLNTFTEDYDSCTYLPGSHIPDTLVGRLFSGLAKWDSLFFIQIAHEGYVFEKNHAFFPMFPLMIRALGFVLTPFLGVLNKDEVFLISGAIISWASFIGGLYYLKKLSLLVYKDEALSAAVCYMYILSPAGIFLTAIYSESLFGFFSISGLYFLYKSSFNDAISGVAFKISSESRIVSTILFTLATATRSNGSFLFIFPLCFSFNYLLRLKLNHTLTPTIIIKELLTLFISGFIQALPIFSVLYYGYSIYCQGPLKSPYCSALFPSIYNYIQQKYWNVGFLSYWEIKQIPNFLLAAPMIYLSAYGVIEYIRSDVKRFLSCSAICSNKKSLNDFCANPLVMPFIVYWAVNLFVLVFVANTQIITRTLSTMPALYWLIYKSFGNKLWLQLFFATYFMLGIHLFSNFYPWT